MSPRGVPKAILALALLWEGAAVRAATPLEEAGKPSADPRLEVASHPIGLAVSPVEMDGRLDEAAWEQALSLDLVYEIWPAENEPASASTEVLLTYDEHNLYVGFKIHENDTGEIRAHLSDRDQAWDDDWVGILIDTWNDHRRAFAFFVNPLGVQMDFIDQGRNSAQRYNNEWDAIWESRTAATATGWEAELAIPFSQLQFARERGPRTWGVRADRGHQRQIARTYSSAPEYRDLNCILCLFSEIQGLEEIVAGKDFELDPTLTTVRTDRRDPDAGDLTEGDPDFDLGLSGRWQMTSDLSLNLAVNPDFSQVEADVAQLDVNTRFSLFFPEQRVFFLEGADFFETPTQAVFTRTVADPAWGLKLTGKAGGDHAIGLYVVEDEITNLIFPGNQQSSSMSLEESYVGTVARYRRELGGGSNVGVLVTSREGENGYFNRVAGLDGLWRITGSDLLRLQVLGSRTEYPLAVARDFDQPEDAFGGLAILLDYKHDSARWNWWASYDDLDEDFRADSGFVPRVDIRQAKGGGEHVWWGDNETWYTRLAVGAEVSRTEDQGGNRTDEENAVFASLEGPWSSNFQVRLWRQENLFGGELFEQDRQSLSFSVRPGALLSASLSVETGDDIDFANVRPARILRLNPATNWNIGRHVRLELNHLFERLEVDGGRLFTAHLSQARVVYHFNTRSFLRGIFQLTDIERDAELFNDPVTEKERALFSQLLYSYKLNPRTVLFFGYSENRRDEDDVDVDVDLAQTDRTLFLKLGYAFLF